MDNNVNAGDSEREGDNEDCRVCSLSHGMKSTTLEMRRTSHESKLLPKAPILPEKDSSDHAKVEPRSVGNDTIACLDPSVKQVHRGIVHLVPTS